MNRYGRRAREHWAKYLPERYQQLENPEQFFNNLGDEIQDRIDELMEGRSQLGPSFMANLQALNTAKFEAENEAMRELALLPPENEANE